MKNVYLLILSILSSTMLLAQSTKFGTTVITHGYQLTGNAPVDKGDWAYIMAEAILQKAQKGQILKYNKLTGTFDSPPNATIGEKILLFDWAEESNNLSEGFSEAAADALFSSLIMGYKAGNFTLNSLHFIGHSRGTIVNTEVVERLVSLKMKYPQYESSISIDQVTNLDAHDWGGAGGNMITDHDNHPNLIINCPQNRLPNNGVIAWIGSGFNDSYYQINLKAILDGRPVDGSFNCDWSTIANGHTEIQNTYITSITNPDTGISTPCKIGGYKLSRIGGAIRPIEDSECNKLMKKNIPEFDFYIPMKISISNNRIRGIMNGGFDRGNRIYFPGWEGNNGGISPSKNASISRDNVLELRASSLIQGKICHNRFYVPIDASYISYDRQYMSNTPSDFFVEINGVKESPIKLDKADIKSKKECIDVSKFRDKIITLSFNLIGVGQINIDNVSFSKNGCQANSTLFLFDLSGSMNESGANSNVSKLQQAKTASKQTLKALKNNNSSANEEVAVLGFSGECSMDPTTVISDFETNLPLVESRIDAMAAGGGTPLAEAIAASECKLANHLAQTGQDKAKLIVLSDGQATCQQIRPTGVYNSAPLGQKVITVNANQCGNSNYKIKYYTIGFNIAPGSPAERDLQYLSQISGGKYLNVQSQTQLERAFKKFNRTYVPKPNPALGNLPSTSLNKFDNGVSLINSESFDNALKACDEFAQLHPDDCHGAFNLALMQEANDFYKKAIANYQKYLSLCPNAFDKDMVEKQIAFLEEEYKQFLLFQKEVVKSDLEYLKLHFEKIQNGQSVALAEEFKGFLKEKGNYYKDLPELMGRNDRIFQKNCQEVMNGLNNCAKTINRNPNAWDRDATPFLSMTYINLERLLDSF